MKRLLTFATLLLLNHANAQQILMPTAKFIKADDMNFATIYADDSNWPSIKTNENWEKQGYAEYDGYAWYRFHIVIPSKIKADAYWKDSIRIALARIDDVDAVFINGKKIGQTGSFPTDKNGYQTAWNINRDYHVAANDGTIHWDAENLIAVRVYDGNGAGGIFGSIPFIRMMDISDGLSIKNKSVSLNRISMHYDELTASVNTEIVNSLNLKIEGNLITIAYNGFDKTSTIISSAAITLQPNEVKKLNNSLKSVQGSMITYKFTEKNSQQNITAAVTLPYVLTPPGTMAAKIHGARVFGVKPNSPFLFKIPVTGQKPIHYEAQNLPEGLTLNADNGIITGSIGRKGIYEVKLIAINKSGRDQQSFKINCGDVLALTPPMGWNSWNCWGLSVSDEKVKSSAQALISSGLIDYGWNFINIDDGWEASSRNSDGTILANNKFPSMKSLGDYLHNNGLRFGIYSSPGDRTCGGFLASYQHELQDAQVYNNWGIDYLKYDWCSYNDVFVNEKDTSVSAYKKPYLVMRDALLQQPRDIVYSLCQYGMKDVWKWGADVNGNSWRTTDDINDSWESLSGIAFNQANLYSFAKPGRWNDPDMLTVGMVGWGPNLHPTKLTPDEQYTHISMWCLLSSPLYCSDVI